MCVHVHRWILTVYTVQNTGTRAAVVFPSLFMLMTDVCKSDSHLDCSVVFLIVWNSSVHMHLIIEAS